MHLVREPHTLGVEDVENRIPPRGEVLKTGLDHTRGDRREHGHVLPDARPGEANDRIYAELPRDPRGQGELLRRTSAHSLGVPVAPDPGAHDGLVPKVDRIVADRLPLEMVGDREDPQVVTLEHVHATLQVLVVLRRTPDIQVLARARDLKAVVAPIARELRDLLEGQIGPLAGEQRDRVCSDDRLLLGELVRR